MPRGRGERGVGRCAVLLIQKRKEMKSVGKSNRQLKRGQGGATVKGAKTERKIWGAA